MALYEGPRGPTMTMTVRQTVFHILYALALVLSATNALALDLPRGKVVLTVSGKEIANANQDGKAVFDIDMLEALPGRSASIETPWYPDAREFSGPFLRSVLASAGAKGTSIRIKALNDYVVTVPFSDAQRIDTILATRTDGRLMSVRDKGPLFLVYPFDLDRSLYDETYFARSVWQISEIEVID